MKPKCHKVKYRETIKLLENNFCGPNIRVFTWWKIYEKLKEKCKKCLNKSKFSSKFFIFSI